MAEARKALRDHSFANARMEKNTYVKGAFAGLNAVACEWIATNMALELGLPVPKPQLVTVPADFLDYGAREDLGDLGAGVWFGSTRVGNVIELTFETVQKIPDILRAAILLFDWWVLNSDRTLGELGGNPNLLWEPHPERLHVIDHNLTFRRGIESDFWQDHVFGNDCQLWTRQFRDEWDLKMEQAQSRLDELWNQMPEDWYEDDLGISYDKIVSVLNRRKNSDFWRSAQ